MTAQRSGHGTQRERITVAEAVGRTLVAAGAAHVFGVVGSGNFHLTNALIDAGAGFTASRHEMGAACMADAYSRATGRVSVVSVHQGCGFTNALTGFTEAAKGHTPVVLLAGDVAVGDTGSNFYVDQDAAAAAVGAVPFRVRSAPSAITDAARAVHAAKERRAVVLSVPIDLQDELVDWAPELVPSFTPVLPAGAAPEAVERLVELLGAAERPILVGGRGAWGAVPEIVRLAEASGALLATSAAGRGLFAHEEAWALDVMGGWSTVGTAELIDGADLLVVFGAALNRWTTRSGSFLEGKTVVQIDDRPEAFGKHYPVDLAIIGDSRIVAAAAAEAFAAAHPTPPTGYRTPGMKEHVAKVRYWSEQAVEYRSTEQFIDPAELTTALDRLLPLERIVVPDGGNVNPYPGAMLRVPDERGYCVPLAFQSIGLGLACVIGAAISQPERLPVLGTGDGSFMMNLVELDTAMRLGLGLLIVVYNDNAYGAEVHIFDGIPDRHQTVHFPETDIAAIARGYGCDGITVRSLDDLAPLNDWLAGPRNRPFVIDAKVEGLPSFMRAHGGHTAH